jgi:hypothetical protein
LSLDRSLKRWEGLQRDNERKERKKKEKVDGLVR